MEIMVQIRGLKFYVIKSLFKFMWLLLHCGEEVFSLHIQICQPFFLLHGIDFILIGHSLTIYFSFSTFDRYKANVFSSKRERTYDMLLQDIYEKYIVDEHSLESYANTFGGSTSINKLYGNNRKLKDQKVSSFPQKLFSTSKDLIN